MTMSDKFAELKEQCCQANLELPRLGLVLYTFGNVSCCDRNAAVFAIKPSGIDYGALTPEDIVIVDFEGRRVSGSLRPSSDTPTHAVLYREYAGIGGIVHTHSTYATAWAQALRDIPAYGTTHADYLAGPVPCTGIMSDERIQGDYEAETGREIVDCLASRGLGAETGMALVAGHGPFTWGRDGAEAVFRARILEELARMAWLTEQLNPQARPLKNTLVMRHYLRKHGSGAYYGQG